MASNAHPSDCSDAMWAIARDVVSRAQTAQRPLRVLSLGAGVQSTTMLLMGLDGVLPLSDLAIFADTGNEPEAVYRHLSWLLEHCRGVEYPVLTVSNGNITEDVLDALDSDIPIGHIGQPPFYVHGPHDATNHNGRLWRKCTQEYKLLPMRRLIRELVGKRGTAESWIGISLDEKQRMRRNDVQWLINRYPLVDARLTRHDCRLWLTAHGYPTPPKSSCRICPFHSDSYWRDMKANAPEDFAKAVDFDVKLRHGHLPGVRGLAYVHKSCVPLGEIDFTTPHERVGQQVLPLWGGATGECEGVCFV